MGAETLDPIAVVLKFAFLAILYLFLLWVARSALKDLRRSPREDAVPAGYGPAVPAPVEQGTGFHKAVDGLGLPGAGPDPRTGKPPLLRVHQAAGLRAGSAYDVSGGALLGRGDEADIVLEDTFASSSHARLDPQGGVIVLEDLGSTNGTYLNGQPLGGPQPLHPGDRIRIGDSEFSFER
jgi:hypothetical protein